MNSDTQEFFEKVCRKLDHCIQIVNKELDYFDVKISAGIIHEILKEIEVLICLIGLFLNMEPDVVDGMI